MPAIDVSAAAAELLRRRRARASLVEYARAVEIPGVPAGPPESDTDETIYGPVQTQLARHHVVILEAIQRAIERRGRLMIFAPPGAAKSSYASVVAPTWAMGRWPGHQVILASYAQSIALRQSRRARQLVQSPEYRSIWPERPVLSRETAAADRWALSTGSEYAACGIRSGITGLRADGIVIDDPVANREEADSETIRQTTHDEYRDTIMTRRKLSGAWVVLIQTRWHEDDLAGRILPEQWAGESGVIRCRDGQDWEVLRIPAKCDRPDDPLGREIGEYLWPEYVPVELWQAVECDPLAQRTWGALYQQRPTYESGGDFERSMFRWYSPAERPERLTMYGASDYAVSAKVQGDYTEHGVVGMDERGDLWFVDWWSGQTHTDESIDAFLDLVERYRPVEWWDEGGVIDKAVRPAIQDRMRQRGVYVTLTSLPSMADKRAKCQSFRARAAAGTVHLPRGALWAERLVDQLVGFPGARYDDMYDVAGLIGRGVDKMFAARAPAARENRVIKPFGGESWLSAGEGRRRRVRY